MNKMDIDPKDFQQLLQVAQNDMEAKKALDILLSKMRPTETGNTDAQSDRDCRTLYLYPLLERFIHDKASTVASAIGAGRPDSRVVKPSAINESIHSNATNNKEHSDDNCGWNGSNANMGGSNIGASMGVISPDNVQGNMLQDNMQTGNIVAGNIMQSNMQHMPQGNMQHGNMQHGNIPGNMPPGNMHQSNIPSNMQQGNIPGNMPPGNMHQSNIPGNMQQGNIPGNMPPGNMLQSNIPGNMQHGNIPGNMPPGNMHQSNIHGNMPPGNMQQSNIPNGSNTGIGSSILMQNASSNLTDIQPNPSQAMSNMRSANIQPPAMSPHIHNRDVTDKDGGFAPIQGNIASVKETPANHDSMLIQFNENPDVGQHPCQFDIVNTSKRPSIVWRGNILRNDRKQITCGMALLYGDIGSFMSRQGTSLNIKHKIKFADVPTTNIQGIFYIFLDINPQISDEAYKQSKEMFEDYVFYFTKKERAGIVRFDPDPILGQGLLYLIPNTAPLYEELIHKYRLGRPRDPRYTFVGIVQQQDDIPAM